MLLTEDAPSPHHPLGLKGAGEGGINGVGGAIAGAIDDALGMPGAVTELPMSPQRVKELLRKRSCRSPDGAKRIGEQAPPDDKLRVIRRLWVPDRAALHPGYDSSNCGQFAPGIFTAARAVATTSGGSA